MGQFTDGDVTIVANSQESADKIAEQIQNLDEYIKTKNDQPFSTNITDIDASDVCVYVRLNSGRYPNAEWQCQQLLAMVKDLFKGELESFSADLTVPENIINVEFDEEGDEI